MIKVKLNKKWTENEKLIVNVAISAMFISFNANADITWNGFYAGVTAGGIKNDEGAKETSAFSYASAGGGYIDYRGSNWSDTVTDNILGGLPTKQNFNTQGAIYGLSLGFNKQFDRIVLGLEADFSGSNADGEKTTTLPIYSYTGNNPYVAGSASATSSSEIDWFSTARIRAGFLATPSTLLYVTGGVAWAKAKASIRTTGQQTIGGIDNPDQNGQFDAKSSDSETLSGWAAGVGIEHKITQNWSFKGEWIHYDLGDIKVTNMIYDNGSTSNGLDYASKTNKFEFEGDAIKLGINYAL